MSKAAPLALALLLTVHCLARPAAAQDDVLNAMTQARTAYSQKNLQEAATQLQTALQFLNQLLVDQLKTFLPPPSGAWKAEDAEGSAAGMVFMSGLTATRHYFQDGSEQTVDVEIVSNSPLIASMRGLVTNPMMLGGQGRLITLKGQKCIEKFTAAESSGELSCLPGTSMMVTIKGQSIASADVLRTFANQIDFAGLQAKFP